MQVEPLAWSPQILQVKPLAWSPQVPGGDGTHMELRGDQTFNSHHPQKLEERFQQWCLGDIGVDHILCHC